MRKNKVMFFVAMMVFCCMVVNVIVYLITIHRMSVRHTQDFMQQLSDNVYNNIQSELSRTIDVAETVAHDKLLINLLESEGTADQEEINRKMSEYTTELSDIFSYLWVSIVSDSTMAYYLNDGLYRYLDPENNPGDEWYAAVRDMEENYMVSLGRDNDALDQWTLFVDSKIVNDDGTILGICGIAVEIDELQAYLAEVEEKYDIEILFTDKNGVIQLISSNQVESYGQMLDLTGLGEDDEVVITRQGIRRDYTITRYMEDLGWYMIINNMNPYNYTTDYVLVLFNALSYAAFLSVTAICMRYMVRREGSLYDYSYHDSQTGLYNRRAYDEEINRLSELDSLEGVAIAALDINGLKRVNDTLGHAAGDRLIMESARVILDTFREYGRVYRVGGDEFVAILETPYRDRAALEESLTRAAASSDVKPAEGLYLSCGYADSADHPDASVDELVFLADEEMYRRKKSFYQKLQNRDQLVHF